MRTSGLLPPGLKEAGYVEGQNVAIEYRWAEGQYDRLPALAADLVRRQVAVIVATATLGARGESGDRDNPDVFAVGDDPVQRPRRQPHRPGGNVTGVSFLALHCHQSDWSCCTKSVPKSADHRHARESDQSQMLSRGAKKCRRRRDTLGVQMVVVDAIVERDIEPAFTTSCNSGSDAFLSRSDSILQCRTRKIVALAARHALPTIYPLREFAAAGGLMSYGASLADAFRQAGIYTGKFSRARSRPNCRLCSRPSSS